MSYGLLFLIAIIAEVASVVVVASWLGGWTLLLLVASVVMGLTVLSGRGLAIMRDVGVAMRGGGSVTAAIVDGALIALAGVLLIVPGFVSDLAALILLVPPLRGRLAGRATAGIRARFRHADGTPIDGPDGVIDVEATERRVEQPRLD